MMNYSKAQMVSKPIDDSFVAHPLVFVTVTKQNGTKVDFTMIIYAF